MYHLFIHILDDSLTPLYSSYQSHYDGDCGIDLFIPSSHSINHNSKKLIGHGIKTKMTDDLGNDVSYFLYARSSISKTPLIVHNSVGIIDAGYRGEILGAVINVLGPDYTISPGDRLFQICAPNLDKIKVHLVDSLDETERGNSGFGSSGK